MKIDYTVKTNKNLNKAVDDVKKQTAKASFRVLHIHDIQATLKSKGFDREPLKIIEICNAKNANDILNRDIETSLMLPCKINVYKKNGQVYISGLLPSVISGIFNNSDFGDLPFKIEKIIKNIINKAK